MKKLIPLLLLLFSFSGYGETFKVQIDRSWEQIDNVSLNYSEIIEIDSNEITYLDNSLEFQLQFKFKIYFTDETKKILRINAFGFEMRNGEELIMTSPRVEFSSQDNAMISTTDNFSGKYSLVFKILDITRD